MAIHMSQRALSAFYERFPHLRGVEQGRSQSRQAVSRPVAALEVSPVAPTMVMLPVQPQRIVVRGAPVGKPRQTQRDRWAKRPEVLRYRAWADEARRSAGGDASQKLDGSPLEVSVRAYFALPRSWSDARRLELRGQPHRIKPDWDNIAKSMCDALFAEDKTIASGSVSKFWDDGQGARVEIEVVWK